MMRSGPSAAIVVVLCLSGCASVSVRDAQRAAHAPKVKPRIIYVAPFETKKAEFNVDREGAELDAFKQATAKMLAKNLMERLPEVAPVAEAPASLPHSGWLVRGRFVRVNQGSRALRATLGFGLGATKMETEVRVYDLAVSRAEPFLKFSTTGGSNAEPGAIGSAGPVTIFSGIGLITGALGNAAHGISEDAWRTAREIRDCLAEYCAHLKSK
jgi:hypothetical protein